MKTTKPFMITCENLPVQVWPIMGSRDVVRDAFGRVYTKRWSKKELKLLSPSERKKHRYTADQVTWVCFHGGIAELERGMIAAVAGGKQRVPQLEAMEKRCKELGIKVQNLSRKSPQQRGAIKRKLAQLNQAFSHASSPELSEAREFAALALLMRDSLGRLNECVLTVRLDAIDRRLMERIENVYAWIPQISKRQAIAGTVHSKAYLMARAIEDSARLRLNNVLFRREKWYPNQELYLRRSIMRDRKLLEPWQLLRPYRAWALNTSADLALLTDALSPGSLADAKHIAQRIHESAKLKLLQFEVLAILSDIALCADADNSSYPQLEYQQEVKRIGKAVRVIDDAGWKNPVRDRVIEHLTSAFRAFGKSDTSNAKEFLKEAAALM